MYRYQDLRPNLFTDDGQRLFLRIRDRAHALLKEAGAARLDRMIHGQTGDSWTMLACVDRMVELGEIKEIPQENIAGQHRVFYRTGM